MKSTFLSLNFKDLGRAFLIAFITLLIAGVAVFTQKNELPSMPELLLILKTSAISAGAYVIKNFFTNSEDKLFKKEKE